MSYVDRSETKAYSAGTMAGVLGGYGAYRLIGAAAWIPTGLALGSFFALSKLLDRNVAVRVAAALLIAQFGWMLAAVIVQPEQFTMVALDLAIDAAIIGLILFAPTYLSAPLAIAWSIAGIYFLTGQTGVDDLAGQKAVLVHGALRIGVIFSAATMIIFKIHPDLLPESDQTDEEYPEEQRLG